MTDPILFEDLGAGGSTLAGRMEGVVRVLGAANGKMAGALGATMRGYVRLQASNTVTGSDVASPATMQGVVVLRQTQGQMTGSYPPANVQGKVLARGHAAGSGSAMYGAVRVAGRAVLNPDGAVTPTPTITDPSVLFSDTLALTGVGGSIGVYLLRSAMALRAQNRGLWEGRQALHDGLKLHDGLAVIYKLLLHDALALTGTATFTPQMMARLHDALLLGGIVHTSLEARALLVEAIAFGTAMEALQLVQLSDSLTMDDLIASHYAAAAALVDSLLFADTLGHTVTFVAAFSDALGLAGTINTVAELVAALKDSISFAVHFDLDDFRYVGWTMNVDSKASSTYENWPFNSFMRVGGRYYGVSDTGLYRLEGDNDAGDAINARIRMGMSAMGSRAKKHVPSVYLGYSASGDLLLKAIVSDSENAAREAHVYRLHANDAAGSVREARTKIGRGLEAVYWDFELVNDAGADFDIDVIEWMPLQTQRRLRGNAGGKK